MYMFNQLYQTIQYLIISVKKEERDNNKIKTVIAKTITVVG